MTTMRPRASSSWTRNGRTSMMRASAWRSLVMMPDWLPVKLIDSPPSSRMAIARSAIDMRSPAVSSMSSSRRSGLGETVFASDRRSSVVSPIAETTTTTSWPARLVRMTRSATVRSLPTSATLEPPYFWTTIAMGLMCLLPTTVYHEDTDEHEEHEDHKSLRTRLIPGFRALRGLREKASSESRRDTARIEDRHHRRMIARPHIHPHRARRRRQRFAGHHVIQPPPDVPLPHVPPWRPPGEEPVVARIQRAADVYEPATQDPLDERALLRQLPDRARLALLWMHIAFRARHVHVAEHDEPALLLLERPRIRVHRLEKLHLGREVLAAVRHVDRRHGHAADLDADDPVLVVEVRMDECRPLGREGLADVQRDARVALRAAVPVAPVIG